MGTLALANSSDFPPIQTVFLILMENHDWASIKGSPSAPYINSLLPLASCCENYQQLPGINPSLPNYLWLEAGTNFGILDDNDPSVDHQGTTNHLATLLDNAGISWKAYEEDISGTNVPLQNYFAYAVRHDPFVYFDDVTGTNDPNYFYGIAHLRPFTELAGDLASNNVARYNFITPNVCHDMHDACGPINDAILQGDYWLSNNLPVILNSRAYRDGGAIFITWDESESAGTPPMGMIILSPFAKAGGYFNTNYYTHSSTLRTMQEIFGVRPLLGDAINAANLGDLFLSQYQIAAFSATPGGGVRFTVIGVTAGKTNVVQISTDLVNWSGISTNVPATNFFRYTNSAPLNAGRNFYRVAQMP